MDELLIDTSTVGRCLVLCCVRRINSERSGIDSCLVLRVSADCLIVRPRSADELDAVTVTARGGDAAGEIRRLEDALKRLRDSFQEAKRLALGSEEAAAKCQVRTLAVPCSPSRGWMECRK